jgi:hypothetical protein
VLHSECQNFTSPEEDTMRRMRMQTEGWTRVASGHYRHDSGVEVRYSTSDRWQGGWMVVGGRNDGAWASTATEAQYRATDRSAGAPVTV